MIPILVVANRRPTEPYYCYDDFFASCRKHGNDPIVLGAGPGEYKGLISKPKILLSYLLTGKVKDKHMVFCDCFDVVITRNPEELMERYMPFNTSIVFNAERNFFLCAPERFPCEAIKARYPDVGTPFKYLNSGFFIGETEAIITMLQSLHLENIPDDYQNPDGSWHHEADGDYIIAAFPDQVVPIKLDVKCEIAQTLHGELLENYEVSNTGIKNKITNTDPMVIHANGGGKTGEIMPVFIELWRANQ